MQVLSQGGGTVRSSVRSSLFVLSLVLAFGASAPLAFAADITNPNPQCIGTYNNVTPAGTSANDTMNGTVGADFIDAGDGNNTINGGGGDDCIVAGSGDDTITTTLGGSVILAGDGNNTITAGDGNNTITTGTGNDTITTGAGNDIISAGNGNNTVSGGAGDDTITGGSGDDIISGQDGTNDSCSAGSGANTVTGCEVVIGPVFIDTDGDHMLNGVEQSFTTIQAAIDAATSGAMIDVTPGTYNQDEANGYDPVTGASGSSNFNIFVNKSVTIEGVDGLGGLITSSSSVSAFIVPKRDTPLGNLSTIFVQADNVTISGLDVTAYNDPNLNYKTISVIGDNVTIKNSALHALDQVAAIYVYDPSYNSGTNTSHLQSYRFEGNLIDGGGIDGAGIRFSSGAGWSGDVSGRVITNNKFQNVIDGIEFVGPQADPWDVYPVGAATITNNNFTTADRRQIIAWGEYNFGSGMVLGYDVLDWNSILANNTFDKAVTVWTPANEMRTWEVAGGTAIPGGFKNTTGIYSAIQRYAINRAAQNGDTIKLNTNITTAAQVTVDKQVTIDGQGFTLHANFAGNVPANTNNAAIGIATSTVTIKNLVEDGTGSTGIHGINIYQSTGVNLDNVTVSHNPKSGITVNGSTVTVNNITTTSNAWGGINVDQGSGVTSPAVLTVNGVSSHTETGPAIWIDDNTNTNVSVVDTNNQYSFVDGLVVVPPNPTLRVYNLKSVVNPTIDLGTPAAGVVTTVATTTITNGTVNVEIPAGTVITSTNTSWDGTINLPTATTTTVAPTPDPGMNANVVGSIEVGSGDVHLTFSNAVRLTFVGQAGNLVGWSQSGVFHTITNVCADNSQATGDALAADTECKINVGAVPGGDLVVWTKHFSTFVTYTQTPVVTSSGHNGGRATPAVPANVTTPDGCAPGNTFSTTTGRNCNAATPATPSTNSNGNANGRVLGAATFNFLVDFGIGSRITDVTELQKILLGGSHLKVAGPTGYFGALTLTAVKSYQKAHGVIQTGYVGPLTRAELNKEAAVSNQTASVWSSLTAEQVSSILTLIESFGADSATMDKIRAALLK